MRYKNESDIAEVIRTFEDATIARKTWTHTEHLVVALHYMSEHDFDEAYRKMKDGIFNLLINGFKVDLNKEMPYHETLTVFWLRTVAAFNASKNGASLLDKANEMADAYDKDYPLRFYTREFLFSSEARARFVDGDLKENS